MGVKQVNIIESLLNYEVITKARCDGDVAGCRGFVGHLKRSQERYSGKHAHL